MSVSSQWIEAPADESPLALLGVRACDTHAIEVQDRVFLGGPFMDPGYRRRRESCLIIAVNCSEAGALCFCDSMGTGPKVESGYDICLTELEDLFLIEASGDRGRGLLERLPTRDATVAETDAAALEACRMSMGRALDARGLPELLLGNPDHPRWDEMAGRCLSCANCTLVCPTCFCFTIEEISDLTATVSSRERCWDSCFNKEHSQIHGAEFRPTTKDRYRQWLTHKLGSWECQFGTSGCVGCGRCIAWCPVGIDLTEEVAAIRRRAAHVSLPTYRPPERVSKDNPLLPTSANVLGAATETHDVKTLRLTMPADYEHKPGQFNMLSLPGIGEVPISVSGGNEEAIEHTIRAVGATTKALCGLKEGDRVGLRGPYGTGWPLDEGAGRAVTVIAGGIGLAPLREALRHMERRAGQYEWVKLVYGARSPDDLLFGAELRKWRAESRLRVSVTVDRGSPTWTGNIGAVTAMLHRKELPRDGLYLMCGPEVMMRVVVRLLERAGVSHENIYLSMERNMKCGVGLCGRCQLGPYFVCKDGPVFRYDRVAFLFGRKGF